jgi:hypothetical protein
MPAAAGEATGATGNAFEGLGKVAESVGQTIDNAFGRMIDQLVEGSFKAIDAVKELGKALIKLVAQKGIELLFNFVTGGAGSLAGGGGLFGGIVSGVGKLLGFAHGGSFAVGGSGGIDSQLVAFRASPGERVTVTPPGREAGEQVVIRLPDIRPEGRYSGRDISAMFDALAGEARLRGLRLAVEPGRGGR